MHEPQIDTVTPMPVFSKPLRYPFAEMKVGQSLFFTSEGRKESARTAAVQFVKAHQPDWKFRSVKDNDGWRLWRIK